MRPVISYTSQLPVEHLEALQDLFFFNKRQGRYRDGIVQSIETFGEPFLKEEEGFIRVHTTRLGEVQSIFAVATPEDREPHPVGVAVFARSAEDTLAILHVSVDGDFAADGPYAKEMVAFKLFNRTMDAARRLKGVRRVTVHYGPAASSEFPVRR